MKENLSEFGILTSESGWGSNALMSLPLFTFANVTFFYLQSVSKIVGQTVRAYSTHCKDSFFI